MTRDELLQHCRETIKNQRPSNNVERAAINGQAVGDNGEVVILHEHVMRLMVETRMPPCNSDMTRYPYTGIYSHEEPVQTVL